MMKQYRTLLLIFTVLFIGWTFLIVESCAQVKFTQVESDTVLYRIPVAHRTIAGQPGKYFMKYMGLEPLMDSLDLKGTKIDSMTFASDTLKLYTSDGIFKVKILAGGGSGTVTSIATTSPITGGPITTSGTIAINNAAADGSTKGAASFTASDFNATSGNISIDYTNGQEASASAKGFLKTSDWTSFNNKLGSLNGLTASTQTFSISTASLGFGVTSSGSIHTFNLPYTEDATGIRLGLNAKLMSNGVGIGNNAGDAGCSNCFAMGKDVLSNVTTASNNLGIGLQALYSQQTGGNNIGIGNYANYFGTSTSNSIFIGESSGLNNLTGTDNVFIGRLSGRNNTGSSNVFIGANAGFNETGSNRLYISNTTTSTPLLGGRFDQTRIGINKSTSSLSTTLHVGGDVTIDTRTGTATQLMGNDGTGKLCNLSLGTGLTITSGTINQDYGAFTVAATTGGSGVVGPIDGDPILTFTAGSGMTITRSGTTGDNQTLTFSSTGGATDLGFTGASSPVTLTSNTGADVTITAGSNVTFSQVSNNLTINATHAIASLGDAGHTQSFTGGAWTAVTFTNDEDTALGVTANAGTELITVNTSTLHEIHYSLSFECKATGDLIAALNISGTINTLTQRIVTMTTIGDKYTLSGSFLLPLTASQTIGLSLNPTNTNTNAIVTDASLIVEKK